MKLRGLILIIVAAVIPWLWYAPLMASGGNDALGQYMGVVSLILMGITQLLATRIRGIEAIFGSLDRVYVLHKWLAIGALVTAFLHESLGAELDGIALIRGLGDAAEDIGELSYNGIIFLTLISLMTFIPYKYWKWSHRFIGIFFAFGAAHYFFIEKPYGTFEPIGLYISAFCVMGIASYIYLLIPRMFGHNTKAYEVTSVIQHPEVAEINLTPKGKGIRHKAGQFTFLNFNPLLLRETHPFTISSAPQENGDLRFMVKGLGRYTKRIGHHLEVGTTARVSRAYGHFTLKPTKGSQIWIGGGIGVTPFMAWAGAMNKDWSTPAHLYYCVRTPQDALLVDEFEQLARENKNFSYSVVVSSQGNRLTAEKIAARLGSEIGQAHVYFCGPAGMRDALKSGLVRKGLRRSRFHYEEFEMRTSFNFAERIRRAIGLTESWFDPLELFRKFGGDVFIKRLNLG